MKIIFDKFIKNPTIKNSFLEGFVANLSPLEKFQDDILRAAYKFRVPPETVNLQGSMHGGAIGTLIDIATTISILKASPIRNASISLSTQFMLPTKINEEIVVQTLIKKLGKSLVFTECDLYHQGKLLAKGTHIKAFAKQKWQFM